jgi:hypothetical protein
MYAIYIGNLFSFGEERIGPHVMASYHHTAYKNEFENL